MSNFNIIRMDLRTIIEMTDLMTYAAKNYERISIGLSESEKILINDLSEAVTKYRTNKECVM